MNDHHDNGKAKGNGSARGRSPLDLELSPSPKQEPLCLRCSRHMKTCCQTAEVFVTPGDVRRIREYSGRDAFYEYRKPDHPIYLPDDSDVIWRDKAFEPDGTRRVLKRQDSGDCTFLGPAGCALPLEIRPLICRIYPFDYDANGLLPDLARGCPLELVRPGMGLIEELEMNAEQAERWRQQLYAELQEAPASELEPVARR